MILRLTGRETSLVLRNRPQLLKVQSLTGVPWQAIAAVWYRENNLQLISARLGGPFQFDPPAQALEITNLLSSYTKLTADEIAEYIKAGIDDFETGALVAACYLRHKSKAVLTPTCSDEDIKDAFWGYNGRAYGAADHSPYVMNGWDKDHMGSDGKGMVLIGSLPDEKDPSKRIEVHTVDRRPGAFTVYTQLKAFVA